MKDKILDILVLLCAVWIIVARLLFSQIRYAAVAAAIIIVLSIIKLVQKKA